MSTSTTTTSSSHYLLYYPIVSSISFFIAGAASASLFWMLKSSIISTSEPSSSRKKRITTQEQQQNSPAENKQPQSADHHNPIDPQQKKENNRMPLQHLQDATTAATTTKVASSSSLPSKSSSTSSTKRRIPWPWNKRRRRSKSNSPTNSSSSRISSADSSNNDNNNQSQTTSSTIDEKNETTTTNDDDDDDDFPHIIHPHQTTPSSSARQQNTESAATTHADQNACTSSSTSASLDSSTDHTSDTDASSSRSTSALPQQQQQRQEKSGLCIGSIFGLDVGGTLAKLVYFEQKLAATVAPNGSLLLSPRQLHYSQAAAARAVLAARRGHDHDDDYDEFDDSFFARSSMRVPPMPFTTHIPSSPPSNSKNKNNSSEDAKNNATTTTSQQRLRTRPPRRQRRHSESHAPLPPTTLRHSLQSNQDLQQLYHLRQDSLPDDLHEFASIVMDGAATTTMGTNFTNKNSNKPTWVSSSQPQQPASIHEQVTKEDDSFPTNLENDETDDKVEPITTTGTNIAGKSASPTLNGTCHTSTTNFSSSQTENTNNTNSNMKRSRSMFDLSHKGASSSKPAAAGGGRHSTNDTDDHAMALDRFYHFARKLDSYAQGVRDTKLSFYSRELGGDLHFIRFETRRMPHAMDLIRANHLHCNICEMGATGGGAHKYAPEWDRVLGIQILKQDELESLVAGMQFVLATVVGECYTFLPRIKQNKEQRRKQQQQQQRAGSEETTPTKSNSEESLRDGTKNRATSFSSSDDEGEEEDMTTPACTTDRGSDGHPTKSDAHPENSAGVEMDRDDEQPPNNTSSSSTPSTPTHDNNHPPKHGVGDDWWWSRKVQRDAISYSNTYPYLLVTIGTGVSILRVDGPRQHERISGSTIGGGTYWGLIRLLTDVEDFEDVMKLAERGDPSKVDMMVGDIYGKNSDALEKLGLSSNLVASSFGKLVAKEDPAAGLKQEDLARALLLMVTNNIGQVAYLNAKLHHTPRIYFVGNFLRHNKISQRRLAYAINYWSKGEMEALFLEHEGYFGALGAFLLSQGITQGDHGFYQWDSKFRTSGINQD